MPISMFQVVKSLVRSLQNLINILEKGAAYAEAKKIDPSVLLQARLFPDMFPLVRQVQIASDIARRGAARLAGVEVPVIEDKETTFGELIDRIKDTIAFMETLTPEQIDGKEATEIALPTRERTLQVSGINFLLYFMVPNFYFHMTTAYAILRHNGVELGKVDYLGKHDF
ncbi:MAG: DUF1993 domain-containing protein [Pseudanabaenaceae cyanobacterium SKYGB_i_bin29]|nr:DUF1993 domain-containing protein [Pseudanabaenaceae cyanobacterium SKYG29]MDW8421744.1 DUF1993 domain-containing protein [Pseudanabaenaceae cyanobacterium SKYGB_i_bin29]